MPPRRPRNISTQALRSTSSLCRCLVQTNPSLSHQSTRSIALSLLCKSSMISRNGCILRHILPSHLCLRRSGTLGSYTTSQTAPLLHLRGVARTMAGISISTIVHLPEQSGESNRSSNWVAERPEQSWGPVLYWIWLVNQVLCACMKGN